MFEALVVFLWGMMIFTTLAMLMMVIASSKGDDK